MSTDTWKLWFITRWGEGDRKEEINTIIKKFWLEKTNIGKAHL